MSAIYLSLGIFLLGLVIQVFWERSSARSEFWVKFLFFGSSGMVFLYYVFLTVAQYFIWKTNGTPFVYFLPPYENIFYLLNHHFIRFGLYYLISFGVAILFLYLSKKFNRKKGFRFFENEEPYFAALSIFLLGNPNWYWGWVWYLLLMAVISLSISFVREKFFGIKERMPLYSLWLPVGILVILINIVI